ncbi:MAG: RNA polymerase sigma factor [Chloroflexi bacterium]|nr:MAG: RNA polymerase sigma factor [Chloroflexota bacterium]
MTINGDPQENAAYRPGDRDDFDRLYRTCYPRLLGTIYAITGDAASAEDCVQEAFLRAFKAWPRYRPERAAEAWIYQIAINTAISHRRRAKLRRIGEVLRRLGRPGLGPDPADGATTSDLIQALSALPPRVAADFVLRYHHGYNNREIARLEGVSERTIGTRLNQAREVLARILGPEWGAEVPTSTTLNVVVAIEQRGVSDA